MFIELLRLYCHKITASFQRPGGLDELFGHAWTDPETETDLSFHHHTCDWEYFQCSPGSWSLLGKLSHHSQIFPALLVTVICLCSILIKPIIIIIFIKILILFLSP